MGLTSIVSAVVDSCLPRGEETTVTVTDAKGNEYEVSPDDLK